MLHTLSTLNISTWVCSNWVWQMLCFKRTFGSEQLVKPTHLQTWVDIHRNLHEIWCSIIHRICMRYDAALKRRHARWSSSWFRGLTRPNEYKFYICCEMFEIAKCVCLRTFYEIPIYCIPNFWWLFTMFLWFYNVFMIVHHVFWWLFTMLFMMVYNAVWRLLTMCLMCFNHVFMMFTMCFYDIVPCVVMIVYNALFNDVWPCFWQCLIMCLTMFDSFSYWSIKTWMLIMSIFHI
jgi:hypothetical protein